VSTTPAGRAQRAPAGWEAPNSLDFSSMNCFAFNLLEDEEVGASFAFPLRWPSTIATCSDAVARYEMKSL
jgi:hypothetical protein